MPDPLTTTAPPLPAPTRHHHPHAAPHQGNGTALNPPLRTAAPRAPHAALRLSVTPIRSSAEVRAFIRLPWHLYAQHPRWVPPLVHEQRDLLHPGRNPFLAHARSRLFLARRGHQVVGRIAAVDDPRLVASQHHPYGVFGLFESIDDPEVARALFDAVREWLRARGRRTLLGPLNFSTNRECGLLIDCFDQDPSVLMPYNPPTYPALMEAAGLTRAKDLLAWEFQVDAPLPARTQRVVQLLHKRLQVTARPLDMARYDAEMRLVKELYNASWEANWASVPMTDAEFAHLAADIKPLMHRGAIVIAEIAGVPAGFMMMLPDTAAALRAANGRLVHHGRPLGAVRLARELDRTDNARIIALGLRREFHGTGAAVLLLKSAFDAAEKLGLHTLEGGWTLEDNDPINQLIESFGGTRTKTYRLYRQSL